MWEKQVRINQTQKVFHVLAKLIQKGEDCSYRQLIYDLLDFDDGEIYNELLEGMTVTNYLVDMNTLKTRVNDVIELINKVQTRGINNPDYKNILNNIKEYLEREL